MRPTNFIGAFICILVFMLSFLLGDDNVIPLYFNLIALLVVISGTVGAIFLSYPFFRIRSAFLVARNAYLTQLPSQDSIIKALLGLAVRSRYDGILSLEKSLGRSGTSFLKDALNALVDGHREDEIREVLYTEMYFFKQRREQNERVFRSMASAAPAFGIIGSVIGLIGMLSNIGDANVIIQTIPIALTSTLYGILFSNFILTPIAEYIYPHTRRTPAPKAYRQRRHGHQQRAKHLYPREKTLFFPDPLGPSEPPEKF
ncbi:MAG TPA: flagellar motor protein MotA [Nitrospiria bacterium]|nr:flagellar motor protein MotA [Candidatus Manganitrophaceae bacterium]HIL34415.1 flagellar motor protein MotA [Candidatus Manganitrophaceae bacterium]